MDVGRQDDRPYADSIKISEIRNVIAKNKHCLLDIIPEGIEMLTHAQLCPIVILLKSPSRGVVKEMRTSLVRELMSSPTGVPGFRGDPLTPKQVRSSRFLPPISSDFFLMDYLKFCTVQSQNNNNNNNVYQRYETIFEASLASSGTLSIIPIIL